MSGRRASRPGRRREPTSSLAWLRGWLGPAAVAAVVLWLRFSLPDTLPGLAERYDAWFLRLLGWSSVGGFCVVAGLLALAHDRAGRLGRTPRGLWAVSMLLFPWGLWAMLMLGYQGKHRGGDLEAVREDAARGGTAFLEGFDTGVTTFWLVAAGVAVWALGRLLPRRPGWPFSRTAAAILLPAGLVTLVMALVPSA